jgi:hypothetical protein
VLTAGIDITTYQALLFGHIAFIAIWIGTDTCIQLLVLRALGKGPEATASLLADVEWLGTRLLVPTSLLVVIFGLGLVGNVDAYEISQFWVSAGLAVFVASFVAGAAYLGPESGRISSLVAERGAEDAEVQKRIRRVFWVSRIELVLLFLVVLDMVVKPGL